MLAIIAILASLLLPALNRAKDKANTAVCKNNLRQIGLALQLYVSDFGSYTPSLWDPPTRFRRYYWFDILQPYARTAWPQLNFGGSHVLGEPNNIWSCPSYNRLPGAYFVATNFPTINDDPFGAYSYNVFGSGTLEGQIRGLGESEFEFEPIRPSRDSQVINPSDMVAFADAVLVAASSYTGYHLPPDCGGGYSLELNLGLNNLDLLPVRPNESDSVKARRAKNGSRHSGRFNFFFCDGHVEYGRPELFFSDRDPSILKRWNNDDQPHPNSISTADTQ